MLEFKVDKAQLGKVMDSLGDYIVDETNKLAQKLYNDIQGDTPVRTGQARNGWVLVRCTQLGEVAQVGNDVEHVKYLEFGTSTMEPRRFIQRNIKQNLNGS